MSSMENSVPSCFGLKALWIFDKSSWFFAIEALGFSRNLSLRAERVRRRMLTCAERFFNGALGTSMIRFASGVSA